MNELDLIAAERAKIVAKIRGNAANLDRDAKASAEVRDERGCDKYTYAAMALTRVADQIERGEY